MAFNTVVQEIINNLEKGINPWREPWSNSNILPVNVLTENPYRRGNLIFLMIASYIFRYLNSFWGTFEQYKKLGFFVKKSARGKSLPLFFFELKEREISINEAESTAGWTSEEISRGYKTIKKYILNKFNVFHFTETSMTLEDLKKLNEKAEIIINENKNILSADEIINNYNGPEIVYMDSVPNHNTKLNRVTIPEKKYFNSSEEFYSTLFHEIVHSTGTTERLNRKCHGEYHQSLSARAYEELVAEIGASLLCSKAGINNKTIQNSSAYIDGWLKGLKEDPAYLFRIGADAQKAVDFILQNNITQG